MLCSDPVLNTARISRKGSLCKRTHRIKEWGCIKSNLVEMDRNILLGISAESYYRGNSGTTIDLGIKLALDTFKVYLLGRNL